MNRRYQLIQTVRRGLFSEVWHAKDLATGIDVAIKIYIALDEKGVQEFKEEFLLTYSLNHPNLLHTDYFDISDNRPYLVMHYAVLSKYRISHLEYGGASSATMPIGRFSYSSSRIKVIPNAFSSLESVSRDIFSFPFRIFEMYCCVQFIRSAKAFCISPKSFIRNNTFTAIFVNDVTMPS